MNYSLKKMKFSLLLLAVKGLLLMDKAKHADGQLVPISPVKDLDNDVTSAQKDKSFTSEQLKDIHNLAKNISHSKGHIIQSKEGDPEYRRSYVRKVIRETKFKTLKFWFMKRMNATAECSVSDLQELAHLVHEYETGIDFAKLGGIEFLLTLITHKNPEISSAALSVLTAAIQGNPTVKKYAEDAHILDYILMTLAGIHRGYSTTSLYTLSSFIRNNAVSQLNFFQQQGINILADILKSKKDSMKSKLKVLDLLHDLASEIYKDPVYESPDQQALLKREFAKGFSSSNLCEIMSKYLDYEDFVIQEKAIGAMNSVVENVCLEEFKKPHVIQIVEQLKSRYTDRHAYYFLTDYKNEWRRETVLGGLVDFLFAIRLEKGGLAISDKPIKNSK